uniref:Uncharacterized protein n=1 Tax=Alexandrium monilatum TaxID=311494 RepID=A0A7S4SIF1_9DINO
MDVNRCFRDALELPCDPPPWPAGLPEPGYGIQADADHEQSGGMYLRASDRPPRRWRAGRGPPQGRLLLRDDFSRCLGKTLELPYDPLPWTAGLLEPGWEIQADAGREQPVACTCVSDRALLGD